ncbi:hypothetical protein WJ542_21280 [Paraburkholderia sp. B3]|uniref:hypothetical protein n=1 Tax=Paraburkholderia sp. B3 TaxID=3134791 RepID=UPI0039822C38
MNSSTIDQWRAHLLVASLAATLIQAIVLASMLVLAAPETFFTSTAFRLGVGGMVIAAVFLTRRVAGSAFRSALASNHVWLGGERHCTVSLSSDCPRRALVVLYVRLNRRTFDPRAS